MNSNTVYAYNITYANKDYIMWDIVRAEELMNKVKEIKGANMGIIELYRDDMPYENYPFH